MLAPGTARRARTGAALRAIASAHRLRLRPLALSACVSDALACGDPIVCAGHRHGASVTLAGSDDAVFMSAPGIGLLPAHIVVRASDLDRVLDALASEAAAGLRAALTLQLDIDGVRIFRPQLARHAADMASVCARRNIAAVAQWLREASEPLGLGATAAEVLAPGGGWCKSLTEFRRDTRSAEQALRALIGRGAGTTPAGDDFVTGALAHAWITTGRDASMVAAMRLLQAELPNLTTATGATYLRAAARGEFGSHLVAWISALPRVAPPRALRLALRVAGHGASSGCDTLAGFVAAAEAADAAHRSPLTVRA